MIVYEQARAVGYLAGSDQMAALADAERRYQHARALWQDTHRQDLGGAGRQPNDTNEQPDHVIDLAAHDHRGDLYVTPSPVTDRSVSNDGQGQ